MISFCNLIGGALAELPEVNGLNPPMLPGSFLPRTDRENEPGVRLHVSSSIFKDFANYLTCGSQHGTLHRCAGRHMFPVACALLCSRICIGCCSLVGGSWHGWEGEVEGTASCA